MLHPTACTRLNAKQTADFLGISVRLLRKWREQRPLVLSFYVLNKRHIRYERADLLAFLEKAKVK